MGEEAKVEILTGGRITQKDAAAYLGFHVETLKRWERNGTSPFTPIRFGRRTYYRFAEVAAAAAGESVEG